MQVFSAGIVDILSSDWSKQGARRFGKYNCFFLIVFCLAGKSFLAAGLSLKGCIPLKRQSCSRKIFPCGAVVGMMHRFGAPLLRAKNIMIFILLSWYFSILSFRKGYWFVDHWCTERWCVAYPCYCAVGYSTEWRSVACAYYFAIACS